jgi:hypothetical protein
LTVNSEELEFILSHFEPPAFPRRISAFKSNGGQYAVYSIDEMLADFRDSSDIDCKVNAYNYIGSGGGPRDNNGDGDRHNDYSENNHYNPYQPCYHDSKEVIAKQIQHCAESEAAPTVLHFDLDRNNFQSDRKHENALKKTLAKINETFLLVEEEPVVSRPATVLQTGGGYQIITPLEVDPAKYPIRNNLTSSQVVPGRDVEVTAMMFGSDCSNIYKLPANLFLWFAEDYLTCNKADFGHHPSVRSTMIRVPGSYNSKYIDGSEDDEEKAEVKIVQRWDGHTRCHILHLLGQFYRSMQADAKKRKRMFAKARRVRQRVYAAQMALDRTLEAMPILGSITVLSTGEGPHNSYVHTKYWYIDRLLQIPIADFRKRATNLLLAPYLITIKGMVSDSLIEQIILKWLDQCNALNPLDFDAVTKAQHAIDYTRSNKYLPLSEEKLCKEDPDLYAQLVKGSKPAIGGGGN